jgi:hypothetical protein
MPLLFSYGTLQQEDAQLSTFGRRLIGHPDELAGYTPSRVQIEDTRVAADLGTTHHRNATFTGDAGSRVAGMAFDVDDGELARVDRTNGTFQEGP